MPTDFGSDISLLPDMDPSGTIRTGQGVLAEALARRLVTDRGTLVDDLFYGTDIRSLLNETMTGAALTNVKSAIERECRRDERVLSVDAQLNFDFPSSTLQVSLVVQTASGPFRLVLGITSLTVQILQVG